jgi:hypothetical protein
MLMPMTEPTAAEQTVARVLEQLERLHEEADLLLAEAEAVIRDHPDPDEAFRLATAVVHRLNAIHDRQETKLRELREDQAVRIKQTEETELALTKLAGRLGVSRSRAHQLVQGAAKRAAREE